jgi:hypothetical protein
MQYWFLPALATLLAACSSTPAPNAPAPSASTLPTAATASADPAAKAVGPATAAAPQGTVATGSGSMQVSAAEPTVAKTRPGFRARTSNGETVWCRRETPTGSRMTVESCYTAAQLDQIQIDTAIMKDSIHKTRTPCAGPGCNGS